MKGHGAGEGWQGIENRKTVKGCVSNGGPNEDENDPMGIHEQRSQRRACQPGTRHWSDRFRR